VLLEGRGGDDDVARPSACTAGAMINLGTLLEEQGRREALGRDRVLVRGGTGASGVRSE